jgi:MFS family permease
LNGRNGDRAMSLLHNRGFVLLWSGQFLGILADWSLRTAVLIWVYKLTRSGVAVSLVGLAEALPLLALAPVAGVFVDRWSRAYTMAGAVLARVVLLLPLLEPVMNFRPGAVCSGHDKRENRTQAVSE